MKPVNIHKLKFAIIAVDITLFMIKNEKLHVLLGEIANPYFRGKKGLIGGIVRPNETAEEAVKKHLSDKAGIKKNIFIEQVSTFSKVHRDPRGRVIAVAYFGLAHQDPISKHASVKTAWVPFHDIKNLAYDHDEILAASYERLRAKIGYTNIAQHLLSKQFTLTQLQRVYEIVLGRKLDKRNFRRKILSVDILLSVGKKTKGGTKKPAQLFRFATHKQEIVEIL